MAPEFSSNVKNSCHSKVHMADIAQDVPAQFVSSKIDTIAWPSPTDLFASMESSAGQF